MVSKLSAHLKKLPPKLDTPVAAIDIKQLQGMDKKELIEIIISYQKLAATCGSIKPIQRNREHLTKGLDKLIANLSNEV